MLVRIEDRRFFVHNGVDFRAIARATAKNIASFRIVQGGSTLTQQLIRNSLLTPERSIIRKAMELILALKLERHYSKSEIIQLYCELCYTGMGTRGFEAASKTIFRKPLSALSSFELCALAGLIRKPERTHPKRSLPGFHGRQTFIAKLTAVPPEPVCRELNPIDVTGLKRPRLARLIQRELNDHAIDWSASRVESTIDADIQREIDRQLRAIFSQDSDVGSAAAVVLDTSTGQILAEAAWELGKEADFSPTFEGSIQAGSTFKPFVLLSALEQGLTADISLLSAPFTSTFLKSEMGRPWSVRNYGHRYVGSITAADALVRSDNTAFARLVELLDQRSLYELFERFRLLPTSLATPSVALGSTFGGTRLCDLAAAYAAISRNGYLPRPRIVRSVENAGGAFAWFPAETPVRVIESSQHIRQLQQVLRAAGGITSPGIWAGKSGTTRDSSVFVGYNEHVSAAILVKFRTPQHEMASKRSHAATIFDRLANSLLGYRNRLLAI